MRGEYVYSSRRDLCPSCGKEHGCKIFNDGKIWCLRVTSQFDKPDNYRIMGWLNSGMGAILIPESDFDWQAHRQQQQKQTKQIKRNLQQRLSPLSEEKRDQRFVECTDTSDYPKAIANCSRNKGV